MRLASALACLLALTVGSAASGADWTLDLFSYYRFADETKARQIEGGVIPVEVGSGVLGTWTLTVRAKQVTLDPIVAGPEEILDLGNL